MHQINVWGGRAAHAVFIILSHDTGPVHLCSLATLNKRPVRPYLWNQKKYTEGRFGAIHFVVCGSILLYMYVHRYGLPWAVARTQGASFYTRFSVRGGHEKGNNRDIYIMTEYWNLRICHDLRRKISVACFLSQQLFFRAWNSPKQ